LDNNDDNGAAGFLDQRKVSSEYNRFFFQVSQILAERNHAMLVQVVAVTSAGELAVASTVDVQPMVNQLDGYGNAIPHGVISGLIYMRLQGGTDAVIMDPKIGDIGIAVFADKDISSVKVNRAISNPGSARVSDYADGVYMGGMLNGVPSQFIRFSAAGIEVVSPTLIKCTAPNIEANASTQFTVNGPTTLNGPATATSTISAAGNVRAPDVIFGGKSANSHKHGGVATGGAQTSIPV